MIELRPANCKELTRLWELRTRAVAHALYMENNSIVDSRIL
jgi:hypothetical protein